MKFGGRGSPLRPPVLLRLLQGDGSRLLVRPSLCGFSPRTDRLCEKRLANIDSSWRVGGDQRGEGGEEGELSERV